MNTGDIGRARELLAAYGASRERWPEVSRTLHDTLSGSPEGGALLAEAAALDASLDAFLVRAADPLRSVRILKAAKSAARRRRTLRWVSLAYAASIALGVALGYKLSVDYGRDEGYGGMLIGSAVIEEFL